MQLLEVEQRPVMEELKMTRSASDRELGEVLDSSEAASLCSGDRWRRSYADFIA